MIEHFLRIPRGAGEIVADLVRIVGALSILLAGIGWGVQDAGIFGLVFVGLLLPRFIEVRPGFDAFFGLILIVAAWSATVDLYSSVPGWDIVIHFLTTGALAAMAYLFLAELRIVPRVRDSRSPFAALVVLTVAFGLAAAALWEMVEWFGHNYIDDSIFVTYDDSIGDMAAGGLGALVAGLVIKALSYRGPEKPERQASSREASSV